MKATRCAAGNQVCWHCPKEQRDKCERVLQDNYYKPVRTPDVTRIIQRQLVLWRPPEIPRENTKIEIKAAEWLPGDRDWQDAASRLLAFASTLDDDALYTDVHLVKVHLEGYVRAARSNGMDSATRDTNRTMHLDEVQKYVVAAEERLSEWRSFLGWVKLSLSIGREPVRRRPRVTG